MTIEHSHIQRPAHLSRPSSALSSGGDFDQGYGDKGTGSRSTPPARGTFPLGRAAVEPNSKRPILAMPEEKDAITAPRC